MAADLEVGVLLEPKNDLEDEVGDVEADVGGAGGDISPGQKDQQESIIAGGVSKGLVAAGVLGAILSQLKSITGLASGILGFFSRALLPAVEVIADLLRPFVEAINQFIAAPQETLRGAQRNIQRTVANRPGFAAASAFPIPGLEGVGQLADETGVAGETADILSTAADFFLPGPKTADQTGETSKQQFFQNIFDVQRDKTGSMR